MKTTTNLPATTKAPAAVIEEIVVEQKIEFRGVTKKEVEDNKKNVEKALAKSLGVQADAVKIIDIIEVQKGRRRYLLGSIFVEIIYEVEVEDQTKAKEVESNMKAKEFKSTLDNNIKTESPNLTATVESVEEPQTRRKKLVSNYKEEGDNDVNTGDNKYVSPSTGQACKFWCALGIIVVCCTCVLCGCAGIYFTV